jgi:RNA polymerase sigma-70 factor (ECF subfamily)
MPLRKAEEQFNQLIEDYTSPLLTWAKYKVSDDELARDMVQETFLAAYQSFEKFKGESTPRTWLFSILNRKIIDHYRTRVKQHSSYGLEPHATSRFFDEEGGWLPESTPTHWDYDEEHLLDNNDFNLVLKLCIDLLPDVWKSCVQLKYIDDRKSDEICQELGISPTNYWQILHRSKLQLRGCIEENWFKK